MSTNMTRSSVMQRNSTPTKSRYISNSKSIEKVSSHIIHDFFNDHPIGKFKADVSKMRPVSYETPINLAINTKNYVMVDQKLQYGKPLSQEQLDLLLKKKPQNPEIVTYGYTEMEPQSKTFSRAPIQIKLQEQNDNHICCCGGARSNNVNPQEIKESDANKGNKMSQNNNQIDCIKQQ